jgi:hypothetical protein
VKASVLALVTMVVVAACGSTTPVASHSTPSASLPTSPSASASTSPTTSPAPLTASYAVVVKDFLIEGGAKYTLSIVGLDGHAVATVSPRKRSVQLVQIGNVSESASSVYYLDGDSDVHFLRPDATKGLATTIPLTGKQAAAFAVSPDDQRIAVSILDFKSYPVSTRLYVEDLHGGGNHVELFSSATVMEWPVGWHAGHVVIAVGINHPPQNAGDWFELPGAGYHVADAQSGNRLQALCTGAQSLYFESKAGAVCENNVTFAAQVASWDGAVRAIPSAPKPDPGSGHCALTGPLSPSGVIATNITSISQGGCTGGSVRLLDSSGHLGTTAMATNVIPVGWIDPGHLVLDAAAYQLAASPVLSIIDVQTLKAAKVQAAGFLAGVLPGGL